MPYFVLPFRALGGVECLRWGQHCTLHEEYAPRGPSLMSFERIRYIEGEFCRATVEILLLCFLTIVLRLWRIFFCGQRLTPQSASRGCYNNIRYARVRPSVSMTYGSFRPWALQIRAAYSARAAAMSARNWAFVCRRAYPAAATRREASTSLCQ